MTIYRHVRKDQRQGGGLFRHLRQGGKKRRKRTPGPEKRGRLQGKPMIDTRPAVVELRREPGHWDGDTVMVAATARPCFLTLVDRAAGLCLVRTIPQRNHPPLHRSKLKPPH